jgi:hypothetical protein
MQTYAHVLSNANYRPLILGDISPVRIDLPGGGYLLHGPSWVVQQVVELANYHGGEIARIIDAKTAAELQAASQ